MENDSHFDNLFTEDIYILCSSAITEEIIQEKKIDLNNNQKESESELDYTKIHIYTTSSLSNENIEFLSKILTAVKINIETDCVIHNNFLKEKTPKKGKFFIFDDTENKCSKNEMGIIAPSLNFISQNVELKKSLWIT